MVRTKQELWVPIIAPDYFASEFFESEEFVFESFFKSLVALFLTVDAYRWFDAISVRLAIISLRFDAEGASLSNSDFRI